MEQNDRLDQFVRGFEQAVECEAEYPKDPIAQEDFMLTRLNSLLDQNAIDVWEYQHIFMHWIGQRRPDTRIIHLGGLASGNS